MERKIVSFKADATTTDGEFTGYASTWTRTPDSYGDVVAKGAFADTLTEWGARGVPIPCLWLHRMDEAESYIGAVTDAVEDDHGLKVTVRILPDSQRAAHVHRLLKERLITEMSFAFDVVDSKTVTEGGVEVRELRRLDLIEVSVVPVGANRDTSIDDVKTSPSHVFTDAQVEALQALADAHIRSDPAQEDGSDSNTDTAEASQEDGKAARLEAVARLTHQIDALTGAGRGDGA